MKRLNLLLSVILLILISTSAYAALTWWEVGVPYRVKIFSMTLCNNELYAGTWGKGVYKLSSKDETWHELNKGLTNNEVRAIAGKGNDVYAGTWGSGVFMIHSNEDQWREFSKGLTNNTILSLVVSENNVYAGTWGGGVFMLPDGTSEWKSLSEGLSNLNINAMVEKNGNVYAGTDGGVFRLKKDATSWESIDLSSVVNCLAMSEEGELYAGTQKGVFSYNEEDSKWETKNRGLRDIYILDITVSSKGSVFVGTNSGVFKLKKDSRFFKALNKGLTNTNIQSLYFTDIKKEIKPGKYLSMETIFAGTSVGVYKSMVEDNPHEDKIEEWSQIKTGLTKTIVKTLTINDRDIYAGTNKGVYKLSGGIGSWHEINVGLINTEVEALTSNSGDVYAGTWGGGLFVLRNNAMQWEEIPSPKKYIWSLLSSGTSVYIGTWGGIYRYNTLDMSWVPINYNLTKINVYSITTAGGDLYIGTDSGLYKLPKGGDSWINYDKGLAKNKNIYDLAVEGKDIYIATSYGVHVLREGTDEFELINKGFSNPNVYALVSSGNKVFAGTWRGIFQFDEVNGKWTEVDSGLSKNTSIMELLESGGDLYAGTYGEGVFAGALPPVITTNGGKDFTTETKEIFIEGTCYPYIMSVKVNGSTDHVIYSPGSTTWSYRTDLDSTLNIFLVTNVNELGNESGYSEITVTYTGKQ